MLHRGLIFQETLIARLQLSWQGLAVQTAVGNCVPRPRNPNSAASQHRLVFPFAHPTHTCSVRPEARAGLGRRPAL
jgi:hypothetical protein